MKNQIVQLYNPLLGYVKNRVRNQEDAEDITQDVFLKLAKSNNEGIKNLKSWVYTIAKNTITDYYRKRQLETLSINEHTFIVENETKEDATHELGVCVTAFINQLPEEYRILMTMSELKDVSQKEIAEQLNMNYVTVRSKIKRGRKKLKELFEDCCTILQGSKGSVLSFEQKHDCNSSCD